MFDSNMELTILNHIRLPDLVRRKILQFLWKVHPVATLIKSLSFYLASYEEGPIDEEWTIEGPHLRGNAIECDDGERAIFCKDDKVTGECLTTSYLADELRIEQRSRFKEERLRPGLRKHPIATKIICWLHLRREVIDGVSHLTVENCGNTPTRIPMMKPIIFKYCVQTGEAK